MTKIDFSKELIRALSSFFQDRGYKRRGLNFWKENEVGFMMINLQKSTLTCADVFYFMINVAIFLKKITKHKNHSIRNSIIGSLFSSRINFKEVETDGRLKIGSKADHERILAELLKKFDNELFDYLDRICDPDFMFQYYYELVLKSNSIVIKDFENLFLLTLTFKEEQLLDIFSLGLSKVKDANDSLFLNELLKETNRTQV